jgi:hypothetical protein
MRPLKLLTLGMLTACVVSAPAAPIPSAGDFGWLGGHWCSELRGELVEEQWLRPRGDLMLGLSRTTKAGKTTGFEFLRIEIRNGSPHYVAQPGGVPPTAFWLTASGADWARFENPAHDFPQRVEYRRTATGLHAEIAGPGEGGKETVIPFDYEPCRG